MTFKRWFFGCLHLDKTISSRHRAVFRDIVPAEGGEPDGDAADLTFGSIEDKTYGSIGSAPR